MKAASFNLGPALAILSPPLAAAAEHSIAMESLFADGRIEPLPARVNLMLFAKETIRKVIVPLVLAVLATGLTVEAQQSARTYRIGYLGPGQASVLPEAHDAFRQMLRELGYVEGVNIAIVYRWAGGRDDQLPRLADDLVRLKVDVIFVEGHTPAIAAAKEATRTIPIVMGVSGDPVGSALITSLGRPGGNVTGLTILSPELAGKRLQLLKEALPKLARVAVLWNPANPPKVIEWQETQVAARTLGLTLQSLEVRTPSDFDHAFATARKDRADALIAFSDGLINSQRTRILEFTAANRLPAMYPYRDFVDAGGLISYGPSFTELFRRAAIYVDNLLKGAKPAELPVEGPEKFELALNMKTAKSLGVGIPSALFTRADYIVR